VQEILRKRYTENIVKRFFVTGTRAIASLPLRVQFLQSGIGRNSYDVGRGVINLAHSFVAAFHDCSIKSPAPAQ